MNIDSYQQYFLLGHTDNIQCIGFNEKQSILCTGQKQTVSSGSGTAVGSKDQFAKFIIWDLTYPNRPEKLATVAYYQAQVAHVQFSENGKLMVAVGGSLEKQTISVWNVNEIIEQG